MILCNYTPSEFQILTLTLRAFLLWSSISDLRGLTLNRPSNSQFIQLGPRFRIIGLEKIQIGLRKLQSRQLNLN